MQHHATCSKRLPPLQAYSFYPAYCHSASTTWNTWVKLTSHDIHHVLRPRPGASSFVSNSDNLVLFYLNHPIQYVQVVGVVVSCDDYHERWIIGVDDSSGATIELTCAKPQLKNDALTKDTQGVERDEQRVRRERATHSAPDLDPEVVGLQSVLAKLDVGTVVQAKGTLSTFRHVRQISLKRIKIVPDTNAEMLLIAARTRTLVEQFSTPWIVSTNTQQRLLAEAQGEKYEASTRAARKSDRERRRAERAEKHAAKIQEDYAKEELMRQAEAAEAHVAGLLVHTMQIKRHRLQTNHRRVGSVPEMHVTHEGRDGR